MSAILPFLESATDQPGERLLYEYLSEVRGEAPVYQLEPRRFRVAAGPKVAAKTASAKEKAFQTSHAELVRTAFIRMDMAQALEGRTFEVFQGYRGDPNAVGISLDEPISGSPWSPAAQGNRLKNSGVLSYTSKMQCPSFTLPAGCGEMMGTCPGARLQTVAKNARSLRTHLKELGNKSKLKIEKSVCQWCYATGGRYQLATNTFGQLLNYLWTVQALKEPARDPRFGNAFVETMYSAIIGACFTVQGGWFFRIHDSGDFFSPEYFRAWKEIANLIPEVTFWAPTRVWAATQSWIDLVDEVNDPPANFIVRPSGLIVNEETVILWPQDHPGWAMPTVVYSADEIGNMPESQGRPGSAHRAPRWNCPAYAEDVEAHTCVSGIGPDGKKGCRTCWTHPDWSVNFTFH